MIRSGANDSRDVKKKNRYGEISFRVLSESPTACASALAQLKIWEMKGLTTITAIEDNYNFDFVTLGNCNLVVDGTGQFVTIQRG
jgi:hypothetical protein